MSVHDQTEAGDGAAHVQVGDGVGRGERVLPVVRILPSEKRRDRVLTPKEEAAYLGAAVAIGDELLAEYRRSLAGIRATFRGEEPIKPTDPYLMRDVAVLLIECGLRPEECYRLRWDEIVQGTLRVAHGKTANARRIIPIPDCAAAVLNMREGLRKGSPWVFPANTNAGHIDAATISRKHAEACVSAGVAFFVPYTFWHTRLTRRAAVMDPYTLAHLAGHADFSTTKRYVHPQEAQVREAMRRA